MAESRWPGGRGNRSTSAVATPTQHDSPSPGDSSLHPSDEGLIVRYRDQGDVDALEVLVRRYGKPVYNYLLRFLRNPVLAEEAFQRTFLRLCEKASLYVEGRRVRPWLYSIATHQAIDVLRREDKHRTVISLNETQAAEAMDSVTLTDLLQANTPSPLEQLEEEERREWARRAVDDLPDHLRVVVLLIYYQGLMYREVAEILDVPLGTVKSRAHKALVELNLAWRRYHADSEG